MIGKNKADPDQSSLNEEDLTAFSREYFAAEFSNPLRIGCPSREEIRGIIERGELPRELLRTHLLACSPCFTVYREMLSVRRSAAVTRARLFDRVYALLWRPATAFATLLLLLLAVVVGHFLRNLNPESRVAQISPAPSVSAPGQSNSQTTTPSEKTEPGSEGRNTKPVNEANPRGDEAQVAANIVHIDFENYALLRGSRGAGGEAIPLSPTRNRFVITLPTGSLPGDYQVTIVDAYGKGLLGNTSFSRDGRTVTTTLNMTSLHSKNYRLCVAGNGSKIPDCYPVYVMGRKPK
jgi:hypothetical protein